MSVMCNLLTTQRLIHVYIMSMESSISFSSTAVTFMYTSCLKIWLNSFYLRRGLISARLLFIFCTDLTG